MCVLKTKYGFNKYLKQYRIYRNNTEFEMCDQKPNVCFKSHIWFLKTKYGNLRNTVNLIKPYVCFENQMCVLKTEFGFQKPYWKIPPSDVHSLNPPMCLTTTTMTMRIFSESHLRSTNSITVKAVVASKNQTVLLIELNLAITLNQ